MQLQMQKNNEKMCKRMKVVDPHAQLWFCLKWSLDDFLGAGGFKPECKQILSTS